VPKQPKKQEYGQKKEQQTDPVFIKSMAKLKFERLSINANDELLNVTINYTTRDILNKNCF
jgi:hypothetical protein